MWGFVRFCVYGWGVMWMVAWPVQAQTISRVQTIHFGTFAIKNNSAVHTLRVSRTNVVTADSAFALFTAPIRGEYDLAGFPSSTPFTVTISDATLNSGGGGEPFYLSNFTPGTGLTTDGAGNAEVRFGATLATSGVGANYTDGTYSGTIDITIDY